MWSRGLGWCGGALWVLLPVLLVLPGCTGPKAEPAHPELVLDASITQFRNDEGTRNLRAGVTNEGTGTVTVSRATLDWPGFAPTTVDIDDWVLDPGRTAGFTLRYGEPRCDLRPEPAAWLVVRVDGAERRLPLEVQDPELLVRLHDHECAQRRLDDAASVTLRLEDRPEIQGGEEYLPGAVVVRRRSDAADGLQVVDLGGSVLLHLEPRPGAPALPVRLQPGVEELRFPVRIRSAHRCDAHALGGSQQTFLLSAYVRLTGAPVQRVVTVPDAADRDRLAGIIRRDCH